MKIKPTDEADGNMNFEGLAESLKEWYLENQRILPWRASRNPYLIWISEVMLQQTTVQAVVPFYERFLQKFPTVKDLAMANLEEVLEAWSGLGYYSRAKNLHKSSQILAKQGFPKKAEELIKLPGFGPYTSRAVSSLAFGEKVGVLDGNVIRILTRLGNMKIHWWKSGPRQRLQDISDQLCQWGPSEILNQAMMELGATLCTPAKPHCFRCPWVSQCQAKQKYQVEKLPLTKPKRTTEFWIWEPQVILKNEKLALVENNYAPFLKGQLIFPGFAKKSDKKPKKFEGTHSITHHQIFICKTKTKEKQKTIQSFVWIPLNQLRKKSPSSLIQKALALSSVLILVCHLVACTSTEKAKEVKPINSATKPAPPQEIQFGTRLTSNGENFHSRFSSDGLSLIYVSKGRGSQKNQQIFTWSLSESKERRLTYSDGNADLPLFIHQEQKIAYVSTTDASKERPQLFYATKKNSNATNDLFVSDPHGLPIEKLTKLNQVFTSLDFDGESHFIFSLNQPEDHQIGVVDLKGGSPKIIAQSKDKELIFALQNQRQLTVWLEEDPLQPVVLKEKKGAEKTRAHLIPFSTVHDLSWWDADRETLLISGKLQQDRLDSVYLLDLRFDCLIPLASTNADLWYPSVNPAKSLVSITLVDHGTRQIYLYPVPADLGQCFPSTNFQIQELQAPPAHQ